jgi:hypothetical protein
MAGPVTSFPSTAVPSGVWITGNGAGTLEGCDIFANAQPGVEVKQSRNPTFLVCQINRHDSLAFCAVDGGVATVRDCDLTGNPGGAWRIAPGCEVRRRNNREQLGSTPRPALDARPR